MNTVNLGKICKEFRQSNKVTQMQVAAELGYSVENISRFERGYNRNYTILLWYLHFAHTWGGFDELVNKIWRCVH